MASLYDFLPTEASNSTTGGVNAAEGMDPSAVNDASRAWKQLQARWLDDIGGVVTIGGTGDAQTVTLAEGMTALATGMVFGWKAPGANTGASTAALTNSAATLLGTPKIRRKGDTATQAGDMISGGFYLFRYDAAYDSAAGALVLLNPESSTTLSFLTNTEAVAGANTTKVANANNLSAVRARRNLFDNPALQISTVNGNTAGTTNGYEIADGWKVYRVTSAGTITAQRVQSTTPKGAPDRGRITVTVPDASQAAGEYLVATKTITGREVAHLKYGTASALQTNFRALIKFPAGTYAYSIQNTAANRSYVGLFTPAVANTDEIITANIAGDQSGTWPIDTSQWTFNIVLAAGSTFQGTTGWQAGNILGTSAVTNGMATGSAVFEFGELGWHADPESTGVAPAWELPSYRASALSLGNITIGPDVTLSGAASDFTGIPPTAQQVWLFIKGGSWSGSSNPMFQIGDNGGIETSGYTGSASIFNAGAVASVANSSGVQFAAGSAANSFEFTVTMTKLSALEWKIDVVGSLVSNGPGNFVASSRKTLSDTLDRIRWTTVGGTDTADAGTGTLAYA